MSQEPPVTHCETPRRWGTNRPSCPLNTQAGLQQWGKHTVPSEALQAKWDGLRCLKLPYLERHLEQEWWSDGPRPGALGTTLDLAAPTPYPYTESLCGLLTTAPSEAREGDGCCCCSVRTGWEVEGPPTPPGLTTPSLYLPRSGDAFFGNAKSPESSWGVEVWKDVWL